MSGLLNFNLREAGSTLPPTTGGNIKRPGEKSSKVRLSDPTMCNVHSILETMMEEQREHQFCKLGEAYVKYRKVVAEWMMDVCDYFSLHPTTTHAAIAYLDRLQPSDKFSRYEWQMLAICCILISSKYNESEEDVPDLQTLEDITQQPIPNETVLNYELWALKKMGWKLNARTPLAFVASYIVAGVTAPHDTCWDVIHGCPYTLDGLATRISDELYAMASFTLLETELKQYRASDLAAAMLFFIRRALGVTPIWPSEMTTLTTINLHTNYEKMELVNIYDRLLLPSVPPPPLSSVSSVGSSGSHGNGNGMMSPQSSAGGSSTTRFSPGHMHNQGSLDNMYDMAASPTSPPAAPHSSSSHHPMEAINLTTPVTVRNSRDRGFSGANHGGGNSGGNTMSLGGGYIDVNHTPAHHTTPATTAATVIDSATLDAAISAFGAVTIGTHGLTSPSGVTGLASELSPDVDDAKERNKENAPYKPSTHHRHHSNEQQQPHGQEDRQGGGHHSGPSPLSVLSMASLDPAADSSY